MTRLAAGLLAPLLGAATLLGLAAGPARGEKPIAVLGLVRAAGRVTPAAGGETVKGLHLSPQRRVGLAHVLTDGAGFRWDIQQYGTVGNGTNNAYGHGMFCQISGNTVRASDGQARLSADGREIEIGPHQDNTGLRVYRRVRVYEDRALARWLDIFENPTGKPIRVPVEIRSNIPYGIGKRVGSEGRAVDRDAWAFMTESGRPERSPALLHVVRGEHSKLKPQITFRGNSIHVQWQLEIPARSSVVLCTFQSQDHKLNAHRRRLRGFRVSDLLRDLPAAARRRIVNFRVGTFVADVSLDRSERADVLVTADGDPMHGQVLNEAFTLSTFFGSMKLPADRVIGMAVAEDGVRVLTTDGQVVSGTLADQPIRIDLPDGRGELALPVAKISQWSYRISEDRPLEIPFSGPAVELRSGDRLAFAAEATALSLRTRHGTVALDAAAMHEVRLDNEDNGVHRAVFVSGSELAGFLEPDDLTFELKLGPQLSVSRDMLVRVLFDPDVRDDPTLTRVTLTNGDEIRGRLEDAPLLVDTGYGSVKLDPRDVRILALEPDQPGRAVVQLFDESVLRGELTNETLGVKMLPGPELRIQTVLVRGVTRSQPMSPEEIRTRARDLVVRLGAESYADREAATKELVELGAVILPMVRSYLDVNDPEVRQRLERVVEQITGGQSPDAAAPAPGALRTLLERGGR
ncbi:MAG: hypothetical protein ACOC8F_00090 [Planctomycetota bacterium]